MHEVRAEIRRITIATYESAEYENLPMFAENRVHQRSSGNPYPNRVVNRVRRDSRVDREYEAIILENDFIYLEILPELGGRIFTARDKTNGYDFFYRQHVIKPALIGMLGLWISGGVEFNWPVHHRPSTFLPTDFRIDRHRDGSVTVWLGEHEPLDRMKGMVGIRMEPGRAGFGTRMRVHNRTDLPKSFLWWENAAVPVNSDYRIFFPPDVRYVNFHYKKATGAYPVMDEYFNTQDNRGGNDITYHRNTRNATSYFSGVSRFDFFGGWDDGLHAGVIHHADHHTSVGKKMFTWGYRQLSRTWEKALTDSDGAYAELMASSYSDNQPDFTWLEPGEVKEFSQDWYPIKEIGPALNATGDLALGMGEGSVNLYPVCGQDDVRVIVKRAGKVLLNTCIALEAAEPRKLRVPDLDEACEIYVERADGTPLLSHIPREKSDAVPEPRTDNPPPHTLRSADECFRLGEHVAQYRDPIIEPYAYWSQGVSIDPTHAGCLTGIGAYFIQRCRYEEAADHLRRAIASLCRYNPNPRDTEALYLLGLALKRMGRFDEAYDSLQKSLWNMRSIFASGLLVAQIDCIRGDLSLARRHLREFRTTAGFNQRGACLLAAVLRRQGRVDEARDAALEVLAADGLDLFALNELRLAGGDSRFAEPEIRSDRVQAAIDIACDYADAGFFGEAAELLSRTAGEYPMVLYLRGLFSCDRTLYLKAEALPEVPCSPSRDWEKAALEDAVRNLDSAPRAHLFLGNLLFGRCRLYEQAASHWERAGNSVEVLRNLAIARYRIDPTDARVPGLMAEAVRQDPSNLQLLYERNLLLDLLHVPPRERLALLERDSLPAGSRDDIYLQGVHAANQAGDWHRALDMLGIHNFTPCEGGEHAVADEYLFANCALGLSDMESGNYDAALDRFRKNRAVPENLGGGVWHEVMLSPYRFLEGLCLQRMGDAEGARSCFRHVADFPLNYFTNMYLPAFRFWHGMALKRLGRAGEAIPDIESLLADSRNSLAGKDSGWFAATPFFNCFIEPPANARFKFFGLLYSWALLGMDRRDEARVMAKQLLDADPGFMQANLILKFPD